MTFFTFTTLFIVFMMIWCGLNAIVICESRFLIITNTIAFVYYILWLCSTLGIIKIAPAFRIVSGV